jgi:hypothetical protein
VFNPRINSNQFEFQVYNLNGKLVNKYSMNNYSPNSILVFKNKFKFLIDKTTMEVTKYDLTLNLKY